MEAALVRDLANIYYLTGRVFRGFIYISEALAAPLYFVRQPNHLCGEGLHMVRKPEEIAPLLAAAGIDAARPVALELDSVSYSKASALHGRSAWRLRRRTSRLP